MRGQLPVPMNRLQTQSRNAARRRPAGQHQLHAPCVRGWKNLPASPAKLERKILAKVWELFNAPSNRLSSLSSETSRFLSQQSE
jgi:hypothetical protein